MALIIDVTYAKTSNAKSYVYKDASFKTIENVLPKYVNFTSSDIVVYNGKRGITIDSQQRTPKRIFTSTSRRYDILSYMLDGKFINLESILNSEGIVSGASFDGEWKVQLGSFINVSDNSLFDRAAIKNSLKNLFIFSIRERIILPGYGSCLNDMIGMTMTDGQVVVAKEMIEKMMGWERRISLTSVDISQNYDEYTVSIKILYSIPTLKITSESLEFLINVTDN